MVAGNPVITFPNTATVEAALRRLHLLVCTDLSVSDTGTFAHYNVPAATMHEKGALLFLTSNVEPHPFVVGCDEDWLYRYLPLGKARLGTLKRTAGGLTGSGIQWGHCLQHGLKTSDTRIQLAPLDCTQPCRRLWRRLSTHPTTFLFSRSPKHAVSRPATRGPMTFLPSLGR